MGEANEGTPIVGEVEQKAKRMGWVEQEKFKGDPDRWVEAERFIERGETEIPIMRERIKNYDSTIKRQNNDIAKMKETFKDFRSYAQEREIKAVERAVKDLTAKQRVAVEEGDTKTFDSLEEEKNTLLQEQPTVPEIKASDPDEEIFNDWVDDGNKWFIDDKDLGKYAASISSYVAEKTGLSGTALFDEVKKETQTRFPDKFGNKNKVVPNIVESGTEQAAPVKGKQTYASLPTEAKAECDRFIKTIPDFTKEEYLESYEW